MKGKLQGRTAVHFKVVILHATDEKCKNLSQLQPASCQGAKKSKSDVHYARLRVALGQPSADTSMHDYSGGGECRVPTQTFTKTPCLQVSSLIHLS